MDVVYLVRFGNWNPELKYSLRSLSNISHENVFIAGYTPEWVTNIIDISVTAGEDRFYNTTRNVEAACKDLRVSDDFILMNDDFYINIPMDNIPMYHRGPLTYINEPMGEYQRQRNQAVMLLKDLGIENLLNYDLHIPMVVNKRNMLKAISLMKDWGHSHKRSIYGNLFGVGGGFMDDVKIHGQDETFTPDQEFISSNKDAIAHGLLGKHLKEKFNEKSRYEV